MQWRLVLYFIVLTLLPLAVVMTYTMSATRSQARQQAMAQLQSVAELKSQQISALLENDLASLNLLIAGDSRRDQFIRLAMPNVGDREADLQAVNNALTDAVARESSVHEFFFYDALGRVLASSDAAKIGEVVAYQPYFKPALEAPHIQPPFYELGSDELTMVVTVPVYGPGNTLLGILAARVDTAELANIMQIRTGLGDLGETFLVRSENNYLLTPSRFEGYPLEHAYHSTGIDRGLAGGSGASTYESYHGRDVLGAYLWLPELESALVAEMDTDEALEYFNDARAAALIVGTVAAVAAVVFGLLLASRISHPITLLTQAAAQITGGNLSERVEVRGRHEIGVLAAAFNQMADQFQELVGSLETRVADRTRDLFLTLEVGFLASQLEDRSTLLPELVEFIRDRFNLYYTQVYLLDDAKRYAVLEAGTGEVGQQLMALGHRLDVDGRSIVANSVRLLRPILVADTVASEIHLPNPLLPDTQSEVAIPLIVGGQVLGVLDMQAVEAGTFNEDNLPVFQAMANQIAATIQSAQAYTEIREAVERADVLNRRLTRESWQRYLSEAATGEGIGYHYDLHALEPLEQTVPLATETASSGGNGHHQQVVEPIVLRGQAIGAIELGGDGVESLTDEDRELVQQVADRIAVTVEQFRAFDATQAALAQTEMLYRASERLNEATSAQELLAAVLETVNISDANRAGVNVFER
ncbi:MAG: GAF domain-containing protein, partial [Chloroflexi bacterium]|nr:GAF domain-containing protein [Chloroflexota bacterium]